MWSELAQAIVDELKKLPVWDVTTNKKEISVRCPFCGDSKKHRNSSHLYVNLVPRGDEPHTYYCQRCKAKGVVNSALLKQLKLFNNDLNVGLAVHLKEVSKKGGRKYRPITRERINIPVPERTKLNLVKLKYFNERLQTDLKLEDLPKYKIILNLYDLLDANRVQEITHKSEKFVDTLDKNFMGWVSYDNNYAILRNLSKKVMPDLRYYNYNIFDNYDNTKRFYTIPTEIDILNPKLNVVISEGIFDILGVYFNVEKNPPPNTLFIAVNGVGYNLIFQHLARMGFLDMDVKIYSDNDVPLKELKDMKANMKNILSNRIQVFYNKAPRQKDFGVGPDKIRVSRTII
jgi:hypothetical protein